MLAAVRPMFWYVQELTVLDHLDVFAMNGFEFQVDEQASLTVLHFCPVPYCIWLQAERRHKLHLKSVPFSKNTQFGVQDVHELIALLNDNPGILCRPSRINAMFASRACRMSVMIGTVLDNAKMTRLVKHMSQLDQPWNCPHGRPTMRHVVNINKCNLSLDKNNDQNDDLLE